MIETLRVPWGARNKLADQKRSYIWERDAAGAKFKLMVMTGTDTDITILDVVQWWENYLGPCDMLKGIELTL